MRARSSSSGAAPPSIAPAQPLTGQVAHGVTAGSSAPVAIRRPVVGSRDESVPSVMPATSAIVSGLAPGMAQVGDGLVDVQPVAKLCVPRA
jgi:hypothetical protein